MSAFRYPDAHGLQMVELVPAHPVDMRTDMAFGRASDPRPPYMVEGTLLHGNAYIEELAAERVQAEMVGTISGPTQYPNYRGRLA